MLKATMLDIETSGLNKSEDEITAVGLYNRHQLFITSLTKATASAESLYPENETCLISWNGGPFDIPFLEEAGLDLTAYPHLDLLPLVREKIAGLPSYKKDLVCMYLGIYIPKTYPSISCALAAKTPSLFDNPIEEIYRHNAIDLYGTALLFKKLDRTGLIPEINGGRIQW